MYTTKKISIWFDAHSLRFSSYVVSLPKIYVRTCAYEYNKGVKNKRISIRSTDKKIDVCMIYLYRKLSICSFFRPSKFCVIHNSSVWIIFTRICFFTAWFNIVFFGWWWCSDIQFGRCTGRRPSKSDMSSSSTRTVSRITNNDIQSRTRIDTHSVKKSGENGHFFNCASVAS